MYTYEYVPLYFIIQFAIMFINWIYIYGVYICIVLLCYFNAIKSVTKTLRLCRKKLQWISKCNFQWVVLTLHNLDTARFTTVWLFYELLYSCWSRMLTITAAIVTKHWLFKFHRNHIKYSYLLLKKKHVRIIGIHKIYLYIYNIYRNKIYTYLYNLSIKIPLHFRSKNN